MPTPLTCPAFAAAFAAAPASVECVPVLGTFARGLAGLATELGRARAEFWAHWGTADRDAAAFVYSDTRSLIYGAVEEELDHAVAGFPGSDHAVVVLPDSDDGTLAGLLQGADLPCVRRQDHGGELVWFASHNGRPFVGCPDAAVAVAVAAGLTPAPVSRRRARAAATPATPVTSITDQLQQACAVAVAEHEAATAAVSARLARLRQLCDAALSDA